MYQQVYIPIKPVNEVFRNIINPIGSLNTSQRVQVVDDSKDKTIKKLEKQVKKLEEKSSRVQNVPQNYKVERAQTTIQQADIDKDLNFNLQDEFQKLELMIDDKKKRFTQRKVFDPQTIEIKSEENGQIIKKLLKRLQKQEKIINEESIKRQQFEYLYKQIKEQLDSQQDIIENLQKQVKILTKKNTDLAVELERYKVLAQFLEEENERLRNRKPEIIREVFNPPPEKQREEPRQERIVEVQQPQIIQVPVERIVEVPVEVERIVEKFIEVPVEVIKEIQVPIEIDRNGIERDTLRQEVDYLNRELEYFKRENLEFRQQMEHWKSKYLNLETQYVEKADSEISIIHREKLSLQNQLREQFSINEDLRRRIELMYAEIEDVTANNHKKNSDLERHIRHLEHLLSVHNLDYNQRPYY